MNMYTFGVGKIMAVFVPMLWTKEALSTPCPILFSKALLFSLKVVTEFMNSTGMNTVGAQTCATRLVLWKRKKKKKNAVAVSDSRLFRHVP